eukprot:CAMPEP_0172181598 /NCGR_PEP_ID=MMETSP1050-20130122/17913_1 /TAXON_ID=233186 /ORGANISM="Cryptomonas curvata, Strain CCAP979/52" /LENGTH=173 /DNA_ID=CAMNT_0012854911 /DNA_START=40 /DNA_END=558 /DNA_ORIENTATION=+
MSSREDGVNQQRIRIPFVLASSILLVVLVILQYKSDPAIGDDLRDGKSVMKEIELISFRKLPTSVKTFTTHGNNFPVLPPLHNSFRWSTGKDLTNFPRPSPVVQHIWKLQKSLDPKPPRPDNRIAPPPPCPLQQSTAPQRSATVDERPSYPAHMGRISDDSDGPQRHGDPTAG